MTGIRFEWDEAKNVSNQRKHSVSFEEASQVFLDPLHLAVADRVVDGEQRWQAMGLVKRRTGAFILLVVAHAVQETSDDGSFVEVVRIISARTATPEEVRSYEDENG